MGSSQAARPEKVRSRPLTSRISLTFHLCTKPTFFFNIFVNLNPFLNYFIRKVPILHQPFCQNHSFLSPSPPQACIYPATKGDVFFSLCISLYLCVTQRTKPLWSEICWVLFKGMAFQLCFPLICLFAYS